MNTSVYTQLFCWPNRAFMIIIIWSTHRKKKATCWLIRAQFRALTESDNGDSEISSNNVSFSHLISTPFARNKVVDNLFLLVNVYSPVIASKELCYAKKNKTHFLWNGWSYSSGLFYGHIITEFYLGVLGVTNLTVKRFRIVFKLLKLWEVNCLCRQETYFLFLLCI